MDAEIDGDVEYARALGEIHAEKKDIAPAAVGEVHAHGCEFAQERVGGGGVFAGEELGADAERLVQRMAEAEHPGVAAGGTDGAADLVGERLKREGVMGGGEGAGERLARAMGGLGSGEDRNGLFKAALEQVAKSLVRHAAEAREVGARRQVITVDRGDEKQGANALIEVGFAAAEGVEFGAVGEELRDGAALAPRVDGLVARRGVGGGDEIGDAGAHGLSWRMARSSTSCVRTRSRSRPERESASCASNRP